MATEDTSTSGNEVAHIWLTEVSNGALSAEVALHPKFDGDEPLRHGLAHDLTELAERISPTFGEEMQKLRERGAINAVSTMIQEYANQPEKRRETRREARTQVGTMLIGVLMGLAGIIWHAANPDVAVIGVVWPVIGFLLFLHGASKLGLFRLMSVAFKRDRE